MASFCTSPGRIAFGKDVCVLLMSRAEFYSYESSIAPAMENLESYAYLADVIGLLLAM